MKDNCIKHSHVSVEFLHIECKKSVLFYPIFCWILFVGILHFAPRIEDIPTRMFTCGLVVAVFLWISYEYIRQAFMEITAADDSVSVCWRGRFKQVWQYNQIDRIERVYIRSDVWYCVYHGRKCIFKYTGNFQKAEEMYMLLMQKTQQTA